MKNAEETKDLFSVSNDMTSLMVDSEKKKKTTKALMRHLKPVVWLRVISCIVAVVGVSLGIMYLTTWSGRYEGGEFIVKITVACIVVGLALFFGFILYIVAREIAGTYARNRTEETLIIGNGELRYIYRLRHFDAGDGEEGKFVMVVPLDSIKKVVKNAKTTGLTFFGEIKSGYTLSIAATEETPSMATLEKYVICDYFSPMLEDILKKNNISIMEK